MKVSPCPAALEAGLAKFGKSRLFRTDQSSQVTSAAFTGALEKARGEKKVLEAIRSGMPAQEAWDRFGIM